jgi:transglutaminase-like putative cysteine protease
VAAATFQDTNRFVVELSRVRVNPTILRTNTWADMSSLTTIWTQWISPDAMCQSADPLITSFVGQSLPANYAALLSPYDTARTLHRAVMKRLTYNSNAASTDAVGVLQNGVANSAGFAALLTASLRNVGIPARRVSGFTQGQSAWRFGVEFHLPGVEWLLADPWAGHQNDATGTYAYYFGYVSGADRFVAVDVGDAHVLPYHSFQAVQTPNWWWYGGATLNSHASQASLQPQGVLSSLNVDGQSASFDLTDAPASGSVIVETSTNLINWSPLVTNALSGNVIHYSFRTGTGDRGFYRATVVP